MVGVPMLKAERISRSGPKLSDAQTRNFEAIKYNPGNAEVPVARQRRLLGIPRSSHCYRPRRRRHVAGLMKKMSVRPVCPKPSPSKPAKRTSSHMLQSMDGRARWVDNVIVERWFRSLKSECVRVCEYETPAELRRLVADYVEQYNAARPHQSLGYDTPSEWYYSGLAAA